MDDMAALWRRLETWARAHAPAMLADLRGPASPAEIAALERRLGRELPADVRASLAIHDGETGTWACRVFSDYGTLLSVAQIYEHWRQLQEVVRDIPGLEVELTAAEVAEGIGEVQGPVRPVGFHRAWIPIMEYNGDIFWALDFAPGPGGRPGQVIEVEWEGVYWAVLAPSFGAFFAAYVAGLEQGRYRVDELGLPTRLGMDDEK